VQRTEAVAARILLGLNVRPGELVQVVDRSAVPGLLERICAGIEVAGATPLVQLLPPDHLRELLSSAPIEHLRSWDQRRRGWAEQVDRIVALDGGPPALQGVPPASVAAWRDAARRITALEEERRVPLLIAALPTEHGAAAAALRSEELEAAIVPGFLVTPERLRAEIDPLLEELRGARMLTIRSGAHELRLRCRNRPWFGDDGTLDPRTLALGACVSNLPGGSIYTTVDESSASGALELPAVGPAQDVVLRFEAGRVREIEARNGADRLTELLDRHDGEPRRIGHLGVGLNPELPRAVGRPIVDEHRRGTIFLALGENRYLGGENASSLNLDTSTPNASLEVDGQPVVEQGTLRADRDQDAQ